VFLLIIGGFLLASDRRFFQAKSHRDRYIQKLDYSSLKTGDLIFRLDGNIPSQALSTVLKQSRFSHVGLIELVNGQPFVIHAALENPSQGQGQVKKEPLSNFLQKVPTLAVSIYRPQVDENLKKKAIKIADRYVLKATPFDAEFDLDTPDRIYCTELVWQSYLAAGVDLVEERFDILNLPLVGSKKYLLPDTLTKSSNLVEVHSIKAEE
jgi:uncharacterized protein YycO